MRRFTQLFEALDASNRTLDKVEALAGYFRDAPDEDAVWALWLLLGNRFRAAVSSRRLRAWAAERADVPEWLMDDCYERVGDLAETLALILPLNGEPTNKPLHRLLTEDVQALGDWNAGGQRAHLRARWEELDRAQAFVFHKMLTGGFRIGVSRNLVIRGLAEAFGLEREVVTHRLMGHWQPTASFFASLRDNEAEAGAISRPYPYYLASPLEGLPDALGERREWLAEWKWDGVRAQLIKRNGELFLWSRGEELISERFPEILQAAAHLPDGIVLDGEILAWRDGRPLGFNALQTRIGRKRLSAALLARYPAALLAYDCLELDGRDLRDAPLADRRSHLKAVLETAQNAVLQLSPAVESTDWASLARLREESRERGVEGLILKRLSAPYRVGRVKGDWWKWKVDPFTADLVMVYAQAGHGRRANLFTDYTLAARDGDTLTPVAKAYSGLTKAEIEEIDRWVKAHTLSRYGPVRTVPGELVFEVAFEGIRTSSRHKSGVALRFPRLHRWRRDKRPEEADSLESLRALLTAEGATSATGMRTTSSRQRKEEGHLQLEMPFLSENE